VLDAGVGDVDDAAQGLVARRERADASGLGGNGPRIGIDARRDEGTSGQRSDSDGSSGNDECLGHHTFLSNIVRSTSTIDVYTMSICYTDMDIVSI
jgi:hypothetical protein